MINAKVLKTALWGEISCEDWHRGRRKRKRCVRGIRHYIFEVCDFQSKDEMGDLVEFVNLSVTTKGA